MFIKISIRGDGVRSIKEYGKVFRVSNAKGFQSGRSNAKSRNNEAKVHHEDESIGNHHSFAQHFRVEDGERFPRLRLDRAPYIREVRFLI